MYIVMRPSSGNTTLKAGCSPMTNETYHRLYTDMAWTWPIIRPVEGYLTEARRIIGLLNSYASPIARKVLHLGSGGGHLGSHLKYAYTITGVDASPTMNALARNLNPEATYFEGDMRTFRSTERFDVVLISEAIAYMQDEQALSEAFETAYHHLKPGGVLVTYAEETLAGFQQNLTRHFQGTAPGIDVTMIENRYDPDVTDTTYEATFILLIRRDGVLETVIDRHTLGLFPLNTWHAYLNMTGFTVHQINMGRGNDRVPWFVGVKPL